MARTYEDLIETRPRIRRDVLFTETPTGVLFHNSKSGFRITSKNAYRFTELLVPYLNGEHQVKDICAGFGDQQRLLVTRFLNSLFDRDFVRDVPAVNQTALDQLGPAVLETFDPQLNYIDHYADDSAGRFARFRHAAVVVVGTGPVAEQCVLGLIRNGAGVVTIMDGLGDRDGARAAELSKLVNAQCPVDLKTLPGRDLPLDWATLAGHDVVLVAGPNAATQLHRLETAGVPDGAVVLGAWVFGERAVVGPVLNSQTQAAWTSSVLRLGANVSAADEAAIWADVALPGTTTSTRALQGPLAAMIGNLLAYDSFRYLTGALRAECVDALIIQDLNSLDIAVEPLFPHPAFARPRASVPRLVLPRRADEVARTDRSTASDDDPVAKALHATSTLVQLHTGVVTGFTDGPWTQIPLKVSSVRVNPTRSISREIVAVDLHNVAGARLRALEAAALVHTEYAAEVRGLLSGEALAALRAELPTIDPRELTIGNGFEAQDQPAVLGRVLIGGAALLVPLEAVQPTRSCGTRSIQLTSAGAGAGPDPGQAVVRGLASAVAHRALMLALRGSTNVTHLVTGELLGAGGAVGTPVEELRFLIRSADIFELEIELLDLGEFVRSGTHVILARTTGDRPDWTISCGLDQLATARDALRDLLGHHQLRQEKKPPSGGDPDPGDSLLADLDPALIAAHNSPADRDDRASDRDDRVSASSLEWDDVVATLDRQGTDTIVVLTTPPDLASGGIETAKVLLRTRPEQVH